MEGHTNLTGTEEKAVVALVELISVGNENLYGFWKGKITSKECAQNIIKSGIELGVEAEVWPVATAFLTTVLGHLRVLLTAVVAGISNPHEKHTDLFVIDLVTEISKLTMEGVVNEACKFYGVEPDNSIKVLENDIYKFSLKYPRNAGQVARFLQAQMCMDVIQIINK